MSLLLSAQKLPHSFLIFSQYREAFFNPSHLFTFSSSLQSATPACIYSIIVHKIDECPREKSQHKTQPAGVPHHSAPLRWCLLGRKESHSPLLDPQTFFFYKCPQKTALGGMRIYLWAPETMLSKSAWTSISIFFIIILNWWPIWIIYIPGDCLLQIPNRQRPFVSIFRTHLMCYLFWKILNWKNSALCKVASSGSGPRTAEVQK